MQSANIPVDPERLIDSAYIDADLGIVDRTRRNMVSRGDLPEPIGYLGGRARWRLGDYLAARARLLAAGRPRRPNPSSVAA
ncbi:MAG: hypothetical protein M0038_06265 [Pseudomonadota bacterium]|jgi:hypothetical protein|nr:hypothetical protein [Pseudomonadota bacterium]